MNIGKTNFNEMENNRNVKIAGKLTVGDWFDLKPKLDIQTNEFWGIAFSFFDQRITTRYLNPINQILHMDISSGEGFSVVNLQCSLIETIESFYQGWIYENPRYYFRRFDVASPLRDDKGNFVNNKSVFISFFKNRYPFSEVKIDGGDFYKNVRCGLLHETQTKEGWLIKNKSTNLFYESTIDKKIIYRLNFQKSLQSIISQYKNSITEGNLELNQMLRENFIAKFDRICVVS